MTPGGHLHTIILRTESGRLKASDPVQGQDRRAISVPLTPVKTGLSRSLADNLSPKSGRVEARMAQIPKLIVQVVKIGLAAGGMQVEWRVASPEPAVGVFTAVGFGGGVRAGQWRGRCPGAGPAAVTRIRDVASGVGHDQWRRAVRPAMPRGKSLGGPGHGAARQPRKGGRGRELQISRVFCKPICKPDTVRQCEMGETEPTRRDVICPIRRRHRTPERQPETSETHVVWLITQRWRVQIPPPRPGKTALRISSGGPFS